MCPAFSLIAPHPLVRGMYHRRVGMTQFWQFSAFSAIFQWILEFFHYPLNPHQLEMKDAMNSGYSSNNERTRGNTRVYVFCYLLGGFCNLCQCYHGHHFTTDFCLLLFFLKEILKCQLLSEKSEVPPPPVPRSAKNWTLGVYHCTAGISSDPDLERAALDYAVVLVFFWQGSPPPEWHFSALPIMKILMPMLCNAHAMLMMLIMVVCCMTFMMT